MKQILGYSLVLKGTREMQLSFLKERSENIDIQIRKHQARLHTVQTKLAAQYDDALDAEVKPWLDRIDALADHFGYSLKLLSARLRRCLKKEIYCNSICGNCQLSPIR